ncbi:MAG: hypothetical protein HC781_03275 [Leptolyngbyaceae cyanobacterium CSU_1_4]|nr:hypothetical protein [Leptolyngbyaceae cyanobacterium CSU_1_4]
MSLQGTVFGCGHSKHSLNIYKSMEINPVWFVTVSPYIVPIAEALEDV